MGDEQRVSWQELLAQSRDDFEAGTDFSSHSIPDTCVVLGRNWGQSTFLDSRRSKTLAGYRWLRLDPANLQAPAPAGSQSWTQIALKILSCQDEST